MLATFSACQYRVCTGPSCNNLWISPKKHIRDVGHLCRCKCFRRHLSWRICGHLSGCLSDDIRLCQCFNRSNNYACEICFARGSINIHGEYLDHVFTRSGRQPTILKSVPGPRKFENPLWSRACCHRLRFPPCQRRCSWLHGPRSAIPG